MLAAWLMPVDVSCLGVLHDEPQSTDFAKYSLVLLSLAMVPVKTDQARYRG